MINRLRKYPAFFPNRIRLSCAAAVLLAVAFVASGLGAAPARAATSPTVVSLTFDNQWADQMTAAQDMHAAGMAGTFYVISGWIGLSGFMSMSDLNTLAGYGDEIGGKTVDNTDLPTVSDAEAEREICLGRDVLMKDGFHVTDFAYPYADLNAGDETIAHQCGFNSARGVGDLNSLEPGGCTYPDCPYAETIPPADPYQIKAPDDAETHTTLAEMENEVTDAMNHGGGWLTFSFHQICDLSTAGCDPTYSWSPENFQAFVTWLQGQEASGVAVKTVQQVIGGAEQPAVTAPTAAPAAIGTNALVNPNISTADSVTPGTPACWAQEGYGSNSPAWNWSSTGGQGGGGMETITMSSLSSGDAKLVQKFDLGQCAPSVVTGDSEELSAYYKSTAPVFFTVYQRNADGIWSYLTQSPTFAPQSGWTQASWLTPQIPSGVTAISFGMTIDSNGTLSTSDYSMVDVGSGVPAAAPVGQNALTNPLLTTSDGTGTTPYCWAQGGFGTNTPQWTWSSTGGQTGGKETITMTSLTSGDAKLTQPFDSGNCSPTVVSGYKYNISLDYESTVPVYITVYLRSTSGTWSYWTQSPDFAASSGWTQAAWTTPDIPAGYNGISFGMTIPSVGTLSTSNYSLVEGSA
jgi:Polysaccharide deacetylase